MVKAKYIMLMINLCDVGVYAGCAVNATSNLHATLNQ